MKTYLQAIFVAAMAAMSAQAAEYKPLLEEGKSWIMARASVDGFMSCGYSRMEEYVVQLECTVAEQVEVEGEQCRRMIVKELGSDKALQNDLLPCYAGEYIFLEKEGILSIYVPCDEPDHPNFLPILNFNCQVGDSLLIGEEGHDYIFPCVYLHACEERVVSDTNGEERREIIFGADKASYVEGIGASTSYAWLNCIGNGIFTSHGGINYYLIECRKDGKTIFTNDDFAFPDRFGLQTVKTLTPGKSWTMARGSEEFTVSIDRDTLISGIASVVLKSSEGNEYIAAEENGRVYVFPEHLGTANPYKNAIMLSDINRSFSNIKRTNWTTGESGSRGGFEEADSWYYGDTKGLTIGGRDFKEYLITNAEGEVVASWVDGVGAPDSRSWAVVMPEDFEPLRMIDCRQDGEVVFTAEDFTYQSSISEVTAPDAARRGIYDLQGRRVATPSRGLYIINDQKHLLR